MDFSRNSLQGIVALLLLLALAGGVALLARMMRPRLPRRPVEPAEVSEVRPDDTAVQPAAPGPRLPARSRLLWALVGGLVVAAVGAAIWTLLPARSPTRAADADTAGSAPPAEQGSGRLVLSNEQLQRMIDQTSARLKQDPKDTQALAMLAHSYEMLGKAREAADAFAKLAQLMPKDAQVLADYADALAVANGRSLAGEPLKLVKSALALDPKNSKALALAGTEAFDRGNYAEAIGFWQKAKASSTEPNFTRLLDSDIAEAQARQQGGGQSSEAASPAAGREIGGRVSIAEALRARVQPDDAVFIYARPAQGSRVPVAIRRARVRDLPLAFTLDDSNSMTPDAPLSKLDQAVVVARVSKSGDAMPRAGDLQGRSGVVRIGNRDVNVIIDEVIP